MGIKRGDKVTILVGKDRGKTGKVLKVVAEKGVVVVEGINLRYKNLRPKKQGEKGQKIQFPAAMHLSNIALIDPKSNKQTRIGYKIENGKKVRISKKSKQVV
jgi:large subunit ribosomal protein L24